MSYTSKVKNEIVRKIDIDIVEKYSEIRAIILLKNSLKGNDIELKFENREMAERIFLFLKELSQLKISIKYSKSKKFGEHNVYILYIPSQPGLKRFINEVLSYSVKENEKEINRVKGFVRGVFLGSGYIKSPEKEYALDFFIDNEKLAEELFEVLLKLNKRVYKTIKRNKSLVYMRNAEDIMDIIVLIGSIKAFYSYEETTIIKELKNKTIREMNWEVANETKTLDTARKQIKMINYIDEKIGLKELTPVLEEVAVLRLENQEASLQELGELIGISKSGIRNRFRRIEELYNELSESDKKSLEV